MASGLMSLAYMGEMGIVFNLAYIELKKTRYLEVIKDHIEKNKRVMNPIKLDDDVERFQLMNRLKAQLDEMLDSSKMKRKLAWVRYKGEEDVVHYDFLSGEVIDWFEREVDKVWSQFMVVVSSLCILIMTMIVGIEALKQYETQLIWYVLFAALLVTNIVPLIFVLLGRLLKKRARQCTESIQSRFTKISSSAIESALGIQI
jgi:ABC-type multidrug transport system fused ATPase/permease subunit